MPIEGPYAPSPGQTDATKVASIEASKGGDGVMHRGLPVVVLWTKGRRSAAVRKVPLIRVRDGDRYAVVGSFGGSPAHPMWFPNLMADPLVTLQHGADIGDFLAHVATGEERTRWWRIAAEVFPDYDRYQGLVAREIPLVVLEPVQSAQSPQSRRQPGGSISG